MKKISQKVICTFLALVVCLSLGTNAVFAEDSVSGTPGAPSVGVTLGGEDANGNKINGHETVLDSAYDCIVDGVASKGSVIGKNADRSDIEFDTYRDGLVKLSNLPDVTVSGGNGWNDTNYLGYPAYNVLDDMYGKFAIVSGSDIELIIDLQRLCNIEFMQIYHYSESYGRNADLLWFNVYFSEDGQHWKHFYRRNTNINNIATAIYGPYYSSQGITPNDMKFWTNLKSKEGGFDARYLKLTANPLNGLRAIRIWGTPNETAKYYPVPYNRNPWVNGSSGGALYQTMLWNDINVSTNVGFPGENTWYSANKDGYSQGIALQLEGNPVRIDKIRYMPTIDKSDVGCLKDFSIYGSASSASTASDEMVLLYRNSSSAGDEPLKYGVYNDIDIDCPIAIKWLYIIDDSGSTDARAIALRRMILLADATDDAKTGVYKATALNDVKISTGENGTTHKAVKLEKVGAITDAAADYRIYSSCNNTTDNGLQIRYLSGKFDANDKLINTELARGDDPYIAPKADTVNTTDSLKGYKIFNKCDDMKIVSNGKSYMKKLTAAELTSAKAYKSVVSTFINGKGNFHYADIRAAESCSVDLNSAE